MTEDASRTIEGLRTAVEGSPRDVGLRRMLAEHLERARDLEGALASWRAAIGIAPADLDLHLRLAQAYLELGRPGPAIIVIDEALGIGGSSDKARRARLQVLRARAAFEEGDLANAGESYRLGYLLDPTAADSSLANAIGLTGLGAVADGPPPGDVPSDSDDEDRPSLGEPREEDDSIPIVRAARQDPEPPPTEIEDGVALERPRVTFADVGGLDELKERINLRIVHPFTHPDLYRAYGRKGGGGILLYGPPGCGKTYLARATAGELGAAFVSVGISDVLEMWIGSSERNLHRIFEIARAHRPTVLFFDEADALAADRGAFRTGAGRTVINQFLAELDGADGSNEDILVIGATNAPWHLDPAFRRPGRFDEVIFVPPPDHGARVQILRTLLSVMPTKDVDVAKVATETAEFSGADLKGLVDRAVERKIAAAIRDGVPSPLSTHDLVDARRSLVPTTKEWFATVRNYVLYANESGLYDAVRPYMSKR